MPDSTGSHDASDRNDSDHPGRPRPDPFLKTVVSSVVGDITLVRRIGEGGFGIVYEGQRANPPGTVAVKVMQPHGNSPELTRRFVKEARFLGKLNHKAIVKLLGTGECVVNGTHTPAIILEYVKEAKPITKYAGDLALPTRRRLEIFLEVCEAIGHAHESCVLHRDLKPGNILVDSESCPKVIDFNAGREKHAATVSGSSHTDAGLVPGTPAYMSPEQFDNASSAIDVRTDVYALGVVLQELLTGRTPHAVANLSRYEASGIVRTEPPEPLPRGDRAIDRQVRAIVAKCLQKERSWRYSSATELAKDLRRHLAGEPIAPTSSEVTDSIRYFAKKHAAATAAGVMLLSLLAATIGITVFSARLHHEKTRANTAAARANEESARFQRQLYVANVRHLADATDLPHVALSRELFDNTAALVAPPRQEDEPPRAPDIDLPIELRCLRPAIEQPIATLREKSPAGRFAPIRTVAISPDGKRCVTGDDDAVARLWSDSGELIATLLHGHRVTRVRFHPGGGRFATASRDGFVRLWAAGSGAPLGKLPCGTIVGDIAYDAAGERLAAGCSDGSVRIFTAGATEPLVIRAHGKRITAVALSPDGRFVATTSEDKTAALFDSRDGTPIETFSSGNEPSECIAFSPDGTLVASEAPAHAIRLWNTVTQTSSLIKGHLGHITRFCFSPDGRWLATASHDDNAIVWDTTDGRRVATMGGHDANVTDLAFGPDGKQLATASSDRTIRRWWAETGELSRTLKGHLNRIESVAWAADGRTILSGARDGSALLWDGGPADGPGVMRGHDGEVDGVAFLSDGPRMMTWSRDGSARLWDADTATLIHRFGPRRQPIRSAAVSPDGSLVAVGGDDELVILQDTSDGSTRQTLHGHARQVVSLDFSADGGLVASGSTDGSGRLWDSATGALRKTLPGHASGVVVIRFSPAGRHVATLEKSGTARLWEVDGAADPMLLDSATEPVRSIAFSPDGALLALGCEGGSTCLVHSRSGAPAGSLQAGSNTVTQLAFDPTSKRLVTVTPSGGCHLWGVAERAHLGRLAEHLTAVQSIRFSPDGTRIATGGSDRTVRLWEADTGMPLLTLRGHRGAVLGIAFSTDGQDLASASADGTVRLWTRTDAEIHAQRRLAATGEPTEGTLAALPTAPLPAR
jgi:eukaryotic-like serine/threonine-protein kinase